MTERFLNEGYSVTCIDRFYFGFDSIQTFISNPNYRFVQKDIRLLSDIDFENIDIVVDLAGISNDPACDLDEGLTKKINHLGTVNVAKNAKKAGVSKYIMASSCSIYGASDGEPLDESSEKLVSLYAKSKIDSENDIIKLSTDSFSVTFLRLATVFGLSFRMRFDLIVNIMTLYAFRENKIVNSRGRSTVEAIGSHIKDVARAFQMVAESEISLINGQAFNVGSTDQNYQVYNVANIIKNTISNSIKIELVPDDPDKKEIIMLTLIKYVKRI